MVSPFVPIGDDYVLRKHAASEGREVTLTEMEGLLAHAYFTADTFAEHVNECLAGLITLQFGWEPRELRCYRHIVNLEHITETASEYKELLRTVPCMSECESEGGYQLDEQIDNPALPEQMEDLYRANPGRFWWLTGLLLAASPEWNETVNRTFERLRSVGLIDAGSPGVERPTPPSVRS